MPINIIKNINIKLGRVVVNCPMVEITNDNKEKVIEQFKTLIDMSLEMYSNTCYIASIFNVEII